MAPSTAAFPDDGRLLAIDWGEKRIGLAISDTAQHHAFPLGSLSRRQGKRFPLKQLKEFLDQRAPVGVVFSLPLDESGAEGPPARRARVEGELVRDKTGLPVAFFDERMTTLCARAKRVIESSRITTSLLCSTSRRAFSSTISAT